MKPKAQRVRRSPSARKKPSAAAPAESRSIGTGPAPAESAPPPEQPRKKGRVFSKAQRFIRAVFAEHDPVGIAGKLLEEGTDATKAKIFTQCLEYLYGKPVQQIESREPPGYRAPYSFITHIPRPEYPAQDPDADDSSGSSAPAAGGRARASGFETNQEDEHE